MKAEAEGEEVARAEVAYNNLATSLTIFFHCRG